MKKSIIASVLLCATIVMSGCSGLGSTTSSSTASTIGSSLLTSALTGSTTSTSTSALASTGTSVLSSLLSSVLSGKTSTSSIYGTWTYSQPSVKFESENVLAQLGGTVASSKIESALGTQLTKIGFSAGKSTITFNQDGSFTMTLSKKSYSGTYTFSGSTMTLKGAFGLTSLSCTCSVVGSTMYMLFDANKLFSLVSSVGSVNSTLSSLLGNYNGMKLGWTMTK